MSKHTTRSKANEVLEAGDTRGDVHTGRSVITMPTHDDIAKRAYVIYVRNGSKKGQCKQNWHQAENDLRTGDNRL